MSETAAKIASSGTLFDILGPRKAQEAVCEAEREIVAALRATAFSPTGIRDVDYLVDQWWLRRARARA